MGGRGVGLEPVATVRSLEAEPRKIRKLHWGQEEKGTTEDELAG